MSLPWSRMKMQPGFVKRISQYEEIFGRGNYAWPMT